MEYRQTATTKLPEHKQIPNIVLSSAELLAGPDQLPGVAVAGNGKIKKITDEHPESYEGSIVRIPFNNVVVSIMEIKGYKDMGAEGIWTHAHMNGEAIDQERFQPIHGICETPDLLILICPMGGQKVPESPTEDASRYELWFLIGWLYQTIVAISRFAFAGIFENLPNLKIVAHHAGAMIPMLKGRIENGLKTYGGRVAPELKEELTRTRMKGNPLDTFKKSYVDMASFGSAAAIRCGIEPFEEDHVLFASGTPLDSEQGPDYIDRTLKAIDSLDFSAENQSAILSGNAKRIFHV